MTAFHAQTLAITEFGKIVKKSGGLKSKFLSTLTDFSNISTTF